MSTTLDLVQTIILYLYPVIFIMGCIGNVLSFIIFRQNKFETTIFYIYFPLLNICNTLTIPYVIIDFLDYQFNIVVRNMSLLLCKSNLYFIYSMAPVAGYIIVIVGLDRLITISCPNKFLFRTSKYFQYGVCFMFLVYNLAFYTPLIIFSDYESIYDNETNSTIYICKQNDNGLVYKMDFFNSTVVPFILMIFSTCGTLIVLFKSRKKSQKKINKKDVRFSVTAIFLDITFLVLNLPIVLYLLLSVYIEIEEKISDFLYVVTSLFYYMNFGIMFYVNFYVNNLFKTELQSFYSRARSISIIGQR